jgi:hypothetical protein
MKEEKSLIAKLRALFRTQSGTAPVPGEGGVVSKQVRTRAALNPSRLPSG